MPLRHLEARAVADTLIDIYIDPEKRLQTITGFGGAFTESSAHLLNAISEQNRNEILEAYFGDEGARYSLCRTHMNSCDFSLDQYSYTPVENDTALEYFSIEEDQEDIIPMILDAQAISSEGFKLMASPWTAPPWMKDNKSWVGGRLLKNFILHGLSSFRCITKRTKKKVLISGALPWKMSPMAMEIVGKVCSTLPKK